MASSVSEGSNERHHPLEREAPELKEFSVSMSFYEFDDDLRLRRVEALPSEAKPLEGYVEEMINTVFVWNIRRLGRDLWGDPLAYLYGDRLGWWGGLDAVCVGQSGKLYLIEFKKGSATRRDLTKLERDVVEFCNAPDRGAHLKERYRHRHGWRRWVERRMLAGFHLYGRVGTMKDAHDLVYLASKDNDRDPAWFDKTTDRVAGHLVERPKKLEAFLDERLDLCLADLNLETPVVGIVSTRVSGPAWKDVTNSLSSACPGAALQHISFTLYATDRESTNMYYLGVERRG